MKVMVETNQDNTDHHKVGPIYGFWDLGLYIGINRGYIGVVIYEATSDIIDEAIGADIP